MKEEILSISFFGQIETNKHNYTFEASNLQQFEEYFFHFLEKILKGQDHYNGEDEDEIE